MSVVSNTTPLNYLILIGRAEILRVLYERTFIPSAVFGELTSYKAPKLVRDWILNRPDWLRVQDAPDITGSALDEIQIGEFSWLNSFGRISLSSTIAELGA